MEDYKILISKPAELDLQKIYNYISFELKEINIAKQLILKLKEEIFSLKQMPERMPLVFDERLKRQGIRKLLVDNNLIFYAIDKKMKTVYIVRVLYGKRDWNNIL